VVELERVKAATLLEGIVSRTTVKDQSLVKVHRKYLRITSCYWSVSNMVYVDTDKHTCLNTGSGKEWVAKVFKTQKRNILV
jgi:hypothetical protein